MRTLVVLSLYDIVGGYIHVLGEGQHNQQQNYTLVLCGYDPSLLTLITVFSAHA